MLEVELSGIELSGARLASANLNSASMFDANLIGSDQRRVATPLTQRDYLKQCVKLIENLKRSDVEF